MSVYYSQNGEDFLLEQLFKDKAFGFFVEVGSIDGRRFSNTLTFEERGWKGLCIEAHADYIDLLKQNRPHSIICHCAAGEEDEQSVTFYANSRGSLSTLDCSKESEFKETYGVYFTGFEKQNVKKRRLDTLFNEHAITKIDVISIDVEGYEIEVLKGLNLEKYRPIVFVIKSESAEHETQLDNILIPHGYIKSVKIEQNRFYLLDPHLEQRIKGKKFEVELTHTRHPLDEGGDMQVEKMIDTRSRQNMLCRLVTFKKKITSLAHKLQKNAKRASNEPCSNPSRFTFFDVGFHGDRYLLQFADLVLCKCGYFIETGTNVGSTCAYVARTYPRIQCFSCEPDLQAFQNALKNTADLKNVSLYNEASQKFLKHLEQHNAYVFEESVLFWLDAHGYGFTWPLKEEIAFITTHFEAAYVLIDDFKVPDLDCFGYDNYQGQECSFEYIKDALKPGLEYRLYYPNYTERTSPHHPLLGWGLLEYGHNTMVNLPVYLQDKIRQTIIL